MTENQGKIAEEPDAGIWRDWVYSTLRETHETLRRPFFWTLLATGVALTVVAGPFGTLAKMSLALRVVFWGVGLLSTSLIMTVVVIGARHFNADRRYPWTLVSAAAALFAVPPAFVIFYGLNSAFSRFGAPQDPLRMLIELATILVLMSIVGNARYYVLGQQPPAPARPVTVLHAVDSAPAQPLLFEKLPKELGRDLVCLRAQDHYVEAVTPRGSTNVLMRLSDAERDLSGFNGLRVHRSWWVNLDHVVSLARTEAGGMELTTSTGMTIPVARGQRATLKAALDQRRAAAE